MSRTVAAKKRGPLRWAGLILFWTGLSLTLIIAQALIALYLYWSHDVPTAAELRKGCLPLGGGAVDGRHQPLPLAEIPSVVQKAFLAVEDSHFYARERGRGFVGLIRDSYVCATGQAICCGATISQQVARQCGPDSWRGHDRLIKLPILMNRLETDLNKDELLEIYLNQVYLGQRAYGVAAAAQTYYGKPLGEISIAEAAQLASLVRSPAAADPLARPVRAKERRFYVLERMLHLGFITEEESETAKNEEIVFQTKTQ